MRGLAIATVLAVTQIAVAAPAEPPSAGAMFQEARELAKQGRFAEACELFAKSYELDPALGTAVNLADCLEREGKLRRAWELFDTVARNSQNVQSRAKLARQRADALAARLATVVVTMHEPRPAGLAVRIGDRDVAPAAEIRDMLEPRDIEVVATAPGWPTFRTVLHAVAGATVTADIPAFAGADASPGPRRVRLYMAAGIGGAGLVGLGVAAGFALSAKRTYDGAFPGDCMHTAGGVICNERGRAATDRAGRRADMATGLSIGGAVLAAVGVAVFLTAPSESVRVAPLAGARELGLGVVGRF